MYKSSYIAHLYLRIAFTHLVNATDSDQYSMLNNETKHSFPPDVYDVIIFFKILLNVMIRMQQHAIFP